MASHIIGLDGPHKGEMALLSETAVSFGCTPDNAFVFDDRGGHARYAEIHLEDEGYVLYDLGAPGGVHVRDKLVRFHRLVAGDTFRVSGGQYGYLERPDRPALELLAVRGPNAGHRFAVPDVSITVGRTPDNDIVVDSARASRRHAELHFEDDRLVVTDQGSSNGTYVNGERIERHVLAVGDDLGIGDEGFAVVRAGEPAPGPRVLAGGAAPSLRPPPSASAPDRAATTAPHRSGRTAAAPKIPCPQCHRAVDARFTHCPFDATELPGSIGSVW